MLVWWQHDIADSMRQLLAAGLLLQCSCCTIMRWLKAAPMAPQTVLGELHELHCTAPGRTVYIWQSGTSGGCSRWVTLLTSGPATGLRMTTTGLVDGSSNCWRVGAAASSIACGLMSQSSSLQLKHWCFAVWSVRYDVVRNGIL